MQVQMTPMFNAASNKDGYSNEFSQTIPMTEPAEHPEFIKNFAIL